MASVDIPFVTSDLEARHEGQVLDALGVMGTPHMQHRTLTTVPVVTCAIFQVLIFSFVYQ